MPDHASSSNVAAKAALKGDRVVAAWFFLLGFLVLAMIVVGGATRLTDSGLSITQWRPITGVVPPLSEADWRGALAEYQATTEYQVQNRGMTLEAFKEIYWWEWGHRLLGRVVGLVALIPMLAFFALGRLNGRLGFGAAALFALGGLQGAIGWWMVASGLSGRLDVAPYRLAVHLGLAFLILAFAFRMGLAALKGDRDRIGLGRPLDLAFAAAIFAQILLGAIVAGLDAGRTWTDWPLMGGKFLPDGYSDLSPFYLNVFENAAAAQFHHRLGGYALFVFALIVWAHARKRPKSDPSRFFLIFAAHGIFAQTVLGIVTLMFAAPMALALAHQAVAAVLFVCACAAAFSAPVREYRAVLA